MSRACTSLPILASTLASGRLAAHVEEGKKKETYGRLTSFQSCGDQVASHKPSAGLEQSCDAQRQWSKLIRQTRRVEASQPHCQSTLPSLHRFLRLGPLVELQCSFSVSLPLHNTSHLNMCFKLFERAMSSLHCPLSSQAAAPVPFRLPSHNAHTNRWS